jgi:large subunit ribosomal protein L9
MQVILLEKVRNLGALGDSVKVKSGYGRNFLIPQGKAVPATEANLKHFQERRAELEKRADEALQAAQSRLDAIVTVGKIVISAKSGDEGKLFGSVGTRDIADAVTSAGVKLEKSEVLLPNGAIRNIGEYAIQVQLHTEVVGELTLSIIAE